MLVLTRHLNEEIQIGSNVIIRIVQIRGDAVRLGIEAPREVAVYRSEVLEAIKKLSAGEPTKGNVTRAEGDESEDG
jgi:carbon storage regulator